MRLIIVTLSLLLVSLRAWLNRAGIGVRFLQLAGDLGPGIGVGLLQLAGDLVQVDGAASRMKSQAHFMVKL